MTINDTAELVVDLLVEDATRPGESSYLFRSDLMEALSIRSHSHMDQVVTRAAFLVTTRHPGYALFRSRRGGYRIADQAEIEEYAEVRSRLRTARTISDRQANALRARRNGPAAQMAARALDNSSTDITMALDMLDEVIEEG